MSLETSQIIVVINNEEKDVKKAKSVGIKYLHYLLFISLIFAKLLAGKQLILLLFLACWLFYF